MLSFLSHTRKGSLVNPARKRVWTMAALALCFCLFLTACGKRPSKVLPPEGVAEKDTVRVYPDIAFDPAPGDPEAPALELNAPTPGKGAGP